MVGLNYSVEMNARPTQSTISGKETEMGGSTGSKP